MSTPQSDLSKKVDAAFREAAKAAILRAKQTGTPLIVWEEGRIKELVGEELDEAARKLEEDQPAS